MNGKQEKLAGLRRSLAKCQGVRPVHAGATDADFQFRERVNNVIDLFLDWLDYELAD